MKNKIKISFLFIAVCIVFSGICGCGIRGKYFLELKAAYSYDKANDIFIKYPSEVVFEPNELLSYKDEKTQTVEYKTLYFSLPKRNYTTGAMSDYKVALGYAVYNNKLVFTQIPVEYAHCDVFTLGDSTNSFIVTIDDENAFLVSLGDSGNALPEAKKLFNDADIENYFEKGALVKLIYAKFISASPDGRYILFESNRDYINGDSHNSLDIYYYDTQTGAETKIMNFDKKEFMSWEKDSPGNFLFREISTTKTGKITYSDIFRYSISASKQDVFLAVAGIYSSYEIIDDQYIYTLYNKETAVDNQIKRNNIIYIIDIYSKEIIAADAGKYSTVWNVKVSESKDYIAFFGSYININGVAIPEIITLNLNTKDMVPQYEQTESNYFLDSFYWLPNNVLIINFLNTSNLYKDLCRFYKITHKNENIKSNDTNEIEIPSINEQ